MFAPQIDNISDSLQLNPDLIDLEIYNKLKAINKVISCIKPKEDNDTRELWLEVSRGTIKDFGEFEEYKEEEIVETYEQFEKLWIDYYPNEKKWYRFTTAKYQEELFFYFDSKLVISIKEIEKPEKDKKYGDNDIYRFLSWLFYRTKKETEKLKQNVETYNKYLEKSLSYHKRFGRIKRKDFWNILGDKVIRLDERLGAERIDKLKKFIDESKEHESSAIVHQMTANDFFNYCEICYNANDYFKESTKSLSPKEKYLRMADGRDAGLRSIEGNSQKAFYNWYYGSERQGAHPWEICSGGNSTHISLFASNNENRWSLRLAGSSVVRVEETVKMAVALYDKNIPFILDKAEAILHMVTGNDYIGIVPDYIIPLYCNSLFPDEDKIIDFMDIGFEEDKIIIANAYWYPLEKIEIND
ncbi:hypothetical protein ES705_24745 [subsurface metagenome]